MSANCNHGLDARFCSMCAPKNARNAPSTLRGPSSVGVLSLDEIVAYLNDQRIRATYGAVADVVGGIAQSIGARLGGAYGRSSQGQRGPRLWRARRRSRRYRHVRRQ